MLDRILAETPQVRTLQSQVAKTLARVGLSADAATVLGAVTGIAAGISFFRQSPGWGILLLVVSATMDAVDGTIARERAHPTLLGGVVDLVSDRVVESAVIIGIAWPYPILHFPVLVLIASWYVNITVFLAVGAALERKGPKLIEYPPGILERTEALIFFAVLGIVTSIGFMRPIGPFLCYAMTLLEIATGVQRFAFGWRMLNRVDGQS